MRGRIVLGTLLATVGLTWTLSLSGVTIFPGGWGTWWPLVLVLLGALHLALPPRHPVFGAIVLTLGAFLQAWRLELVPGIRWAYAAPIALIILGIAILASGLAWRRRRARWQREMHAHWREL